jgi:hypothetical protein
MNPEPIRGPTGGRWAVASLLTVAAVATLYACASSSTSSIASGGAAMAGDMSTTPPSPDPRIGLRPGRIDSTGVILEHAEETSWNLNLVSNTLSPEGFAGVTNSDLAFTGNYVIQGNYNGYQVWDVSNPARPTLRTAYLCPASQSDVSVHGNLLFVSGEGQTGRIDCGTQGVPDTVSQHRLRGIRIFDATDIRNPRYVANVQTCRGSHTHTVVSDPDDAANVYIYVSGTSGVRSPSELPGCLDAPIDDPNTARFRLEVIRVPLADPTRAAIVSSPRVFDDLVAPPRNAARDSLSGGGRGRGRGQALRGGGAGRGAQPGGGAARGGGGPNQCHDITVYPAIGLAGGACGGYGLLLDISDVTNPRRVFAAADSNFSFWHSATFSNDGSKVLFTDEWGGGSAPRCRVSDRYEWGANAIFAVRGRELDFRSYYKMPAAQTDQENCVAHNGSLIPIPGRDVMVQGWYQGGISIFDWTDPANPFEIAFHDRGPFDADRLVSAGPWSVYWYNGYIYSSEIKRGLDVFELPTSGFLTQNEIDAAKTVVWRELNAQEQPQIVWPPSFPLARAYVDQLARSRGMATDRVAAVRVALASAERNSGQQRRAALTQLAASLGDDAQRSADRPKVDLLIGAVQDLANAR